MEKDRHDFQPDKTLCTEILAKFNAVNQPERLEIPNHDLGARHAFVSKRVTAFISVVMLLERSRLLIAFKNITQIIQTWLNGHLLG